MTTLSFPGPSAANYHHMVSSIGSTSFHLLGFLASLILAGFFFFPVVALPISSVMFSGLQ